MELHREIGAKLSVSRKNLEYILPGKNFYEKMIIPKVARIKVLRNELIKNNVNINKLFLAEPSASEIKKNLAKAMPMSGSLRHDLYLAFNNNNEYRLACHFDEISCIEAFEILRFINGISKTKPESVITIEEYSSLSQQRKIASTTDNKEITNSTNGNDVSTASEEDNMFSAMISIYPPHIALKLTEYREHMQDLKNMGYDPFDPAKLISEFNGINNTEHFLNDRIKQLKKVYSDISKSVSELENLNTRNIIK